MSFADDVLYTPIVTPPTRSIHQPMLDAVAHALDGLQSYTFQVDPNIPIEVYDKIAEMVENDSTQIDYVKCLVAHDPNHIHRPANALTIRQVFQRLHNGITTFWYSGRVNGNGVREYEFDNLFSIENRLAYLTLCKQQNPLEWWVVSLLSNFAGYTQHYAFASLAEARKYYAIP